MRIVTLLAVLLAACATPDATSADAGDTPDAACARTGPLGTCLETCANGEPVCDALVDCFPGACTADADGCRFCSAACGGGCRSPADCCGGESCRRQDDPVQCGICRDVEDECDDDRPCDPDFVCAPRPTPACACNPGEFRTCVPDCRLGRCAEDETCGPDHSCVPTSCTDGFVCPPHQACAGRPTHVPHDCIHHSCRTDSDCSDGGFCVNDGCAPELGQCLRPPP